MPDPQRGNERTLPGKLSELLYGQVRSLPYADTLVLYHFFFFQGRFFSRAIRGGDHDPVRTVTE